MKILGIETSCDETAASIVTDKRQILANVIKSQINEHQLFGGVVPELASRAHMVYLEAIVEEALETAKVKLDELDAIAVTVGPGLIGGLIVGLMFAKGLAFVLNKPLIAVNHLEGHALSARLTDDVAFPFLLLLVSGGHCQILVVEDVGRYHKLGSTLDDAAGEAFDKVAKMLGLDYPGGPIIEKLAQNGDKHAYHFPLAMKGRAGCDFSFSGLKTAVRLIIESVNLDDQVKANICASFQYTVSEILIDRLMNAVEMSKKYYPQIERLVIAGGVAANQYLLTKISNKMHDYGLSVIAPPIKLCTDNGAMIAWAGLERYRLGMIDDLKVNPKPRWAL